MKNPNRLSPDPRFRTRSVVAAVASVSLVALGLTMPLSASADPAPSMASSDYDSVGTFSGTVPNGVCAVQTIVTGGAGGASAADGANGGGAKITATFPALPGQSFAVEVGGGGDENNGRTGGAGGAGGGGAGGDAQGDHAGAGGGGRSVFGLDGLEMVVAGGGGGSAGGHSTDGHGFGGDAGLPTASGVFAGDDGTAGSDVNASTIPGGGQGGQTSGPGAGGTHNTDTSLNGEPGNGVNGGDGGDDPNYDAAGGGGAGHYGGGGGASTTIKNGDDDVEGVAGGGGGGGASFVSDDAVGTVSAEAVGRQDDTGDGADGSVSVDWVECDYDLAVVKTFSITPAAAATGVASVGSTVTWTIAVTNNGPDPMTRGDLVTIEDVVPGAGTTAITAIGVTGGSDDALESGAVSCDAALGAELRMTLTCSRPYQPLGSTASGERGLNVGETLTISYSQTMQAADAGVLSNTATVEDRATGDDDDSSTADITVAAKPTAADDSKLGNPIGAAVSVDVLNNDTVDNAPGTVELVDGGALVTEIVVPGQGTWSVVDDAVVFTPVLGFLRDPDPIDYRVTDVNGAFDTATVTVTYVPSATDDEKLGNVIGTDVTVDALGNDTGDWDVSSVRLIDPASGDRVTELTVAGEGVWKVGASTGEVTFSPEDGFLGDPELVDYEVTDATGDTVTATVTVTYVPEAANDEKLGNVIGTAVTVDALGNDTGDWDTGSVMLINPTSGDRETDLFVDGVGTWTVDETTGAVTFTPEAGFEGSPTPVGYEVTDTTGDTVGATITVTYAPIATNDESHGNVQGEPVVVDVLGNDAGSLDPAIVKLIDPATGDRVMELIVDGEGTWTVDAATGAITFTPEPGYPGNPTPVQYELTDSGGQTAIAELVVTYLPESTDDASMGNERGTAVTVDLLGNDSGNFDPTSVRLIDPSSGDRVTTLVVAGEGTWTVDATTGAVTFTPQPGFTGDPTPVEYEVTDLQGNTTASHVVIRYQAPALAMTGTEMGPVPAGALLAVLLGGLMMPLAAGRRRVVKL